MPGRDVMPTVVAVNRMLVRRPGLAVFVGGLEVYPYGFDFGVTVLRRRAEDEVFDVHRDNPFAAIRGPRPRVGRDRARDEARLLRFAVEYADGRRAEATPPSSAGSRAGSDSGSTAGSGSEPRTDSSTPPGPPVMTPHWTRGAQGVWEQRCWVWGLPEEGVVTLVYAWPGEGVPESRFEIDGDVLREAASRAEVLWPAG